MACLGDEWRDYSWLCVIMLNYGRHGAAPPNFDSVWPGASERGGGIDQPYILNVIGFKHESLRLFEFPESRTAFVHNSTIRLSHNNNWWNSIEKQIFIDVDAECTWSCAGVITSFTSIILILLNFYLLTRAHTHRHRAHGKLIGITTESFGINTRWFCTIEKIFQWRFQFKTLSCVIFRFSKLISISFRSNQNRIVILKSPLSIMALNNVKHMSKMTNCYGSTEFLKCFHFVVVRKSIFLPEIEL